MVASRSPPRDQKSYFISLLLLLQLLPSHSMVAVAQDPSSSLPSSSSSRLASATAAPPIPPLPRAEDLCSVAKQYAVPLKLCSAENGFGTLDIDKGSLLAAVAAVGSSSSSASPTTTLPTTTATTTTAATSSPPLAPPQSLDAVRQQLDQATIQAASYLAPPMPGSPEAAALAAAERNATSARERDFRSPKTRGWLIGSAVAVSVVSVLLVILAGKKQKTGKWL